MTALLWKPLLASSVPMDPATEDFDWSAVEPLLSVYASPKLDGYRAMVQRGVLISRNGLPVLNKELQARYGRKEYEGLDGELCTGPVTAQGAFNLTSRVVRKASASAEGTYLYVLGFHSGYDDCFADRYESLHEEFGGNREPLPQGIVVVKQTLCRTITQLKVIEAKHLAQGYEGTMLVRADLGPYPQKPGKENRSTLKEGYLLRLKRFEYEFATILAVHSLEHNENTERTSTGARSSKKAGRVVDASGKIGSATLKDVKTGVVFNTTIGAEALRSWPGWKEPRRWQGVKVRYRFQQCGTLDRPRINSCSFDELGATS